MVQFNVGQRVWEDYNRDRSGVVQEVFTGKKGALYCSVLWDGLPDVCGNTLPSVLAPKVSAKALRVSRKPEFMTAEERLAFDTAEAHKAGFITVPPQPEVKATLRELTQDEVNIIVAALKSFPARPHVRHKIGQLLERLGT